MIPGYLIKRRIPLPLGSQEQARLYGGTDVPKQTPNLLTLRRSRIAMMGYN